MKAVVNNFIGGSRKADMNLISMSYTQNLVFEPVGNDAPSQQVLRSIPGLSTFVEVTGTPRGRFVASRGLNGQPRLFVVFDNILYAIDMIGRQWTPVFVGYVNGGMGQVSMCETGGEGNNHPMLVIADGSSLHAVPTDCPSGDIASEYRNIVLPKGYDDKDIEPTRCTYQFGYLTVNDRETDYFYRSYLYPFEKTDKNGNIFWNVLTEYPVAVYSEDGKTIDHYDTNTEKYPNGMYIPADWCPDNITAMISTGGVLYCLGPRSFQRFYATNNTEMPFNSPNTSSMNIGILAPDSLATIGENVYFLGSSDVGQFGIYRANGSECVRISVPEMERVISQFGTPEDALGCCWTENSHVFYMITFQADDVSFVFDLYTGTWTNRVTTTPADDKDHAWRYQNAVLFNNKIMFLTYGGIVYEDYTKWTEHDGSPIIRLRRGGATINGCTPFYVDNVVFMLSNGYGNKLEPNVRPKVMFRYSLNGTTMSNERVGYMGRQGEYNYMTVFPRLGRGCVLNLELSCSENIDFTVLKCAINETGNMRGF